MTFFPALQLQGSFSNRYHDDGGNRGEGGDDDDMSTMCQLNRLVEDSFTSEGADTVTVNLVLSHRILGSFYQIMIWHVVVNEILELSKGMSSHKMHKEALETFIDP